MGFMGRLSDKVKMMDHTDRFIFGLIIFFMTKLSSPINENAPGDPEISGISARPWKRFLAEKKHEFSQSFF